MPTRWAQGLHASQGDTGRGVALLVTALQRTNHGIRINAHTKVNREAELCSTIIGVVDGYTWRYRKDGLTGA
jgi:hypothetical protein